MPPITPLGVAIVVAIILIHHTGAVPVTTPIIIPHPGPANLLHPLRVITTPLPRTPTILVSQPPLAVNMVIIDPMAMIPTIPLPRPIPAITRLTHPAPILVLQLTLPVPIPLLPPLLLHHLAHPHKEVIIPLHPNLILTLPLVIIHKALNSHLMPREVAQIHLLTITIILAIPLVIITILLTNLDGLFFSFLFFFFFSF